MATHAKTKEKREPATCPAGYVAGREQAALALGVSGETLRRWVAQGAPGPRKLPGARAAIFPVDALHRWRSERVAADMCFDAGIEGGTVPGLAQAVLRKTVAEARLKEHELATKQGRFVPRDDVQRAVIQAARLFVAVLERAAAELAGILAGHAEREFAGLIQAWGNARRIELLEQIHGKRGD